MTDTYRKPEKEMADFLNKAIVGYTCPICSTRDWVTCGIQKLPIATFKCRSCGQLIHFSQDRLEQFVGKLAADETVSEEEHQRVDPPVQVNAKPQEKPQGGNQEALDVPPKGFGFKAFIRRLLDL